MTRYAGVLTVPPGDLTYRERQTADNADAPVQLGEQRPESDTAGKLGEFERRQEQLADSRPASGEVTSIPSGSALARKR